MYKLSKYNIEIPNSEEYYVFNLVSGALVKFTPTEIYNLHHLCIDKFDETEINHLLKSNILVLDNFDEFSDLWNKNNEQSEKVNKTFSINIMTTTKCNARCYYCYEHVIKDKADMSDETVERLLNYILIHRNDRPVQLKWFGGEPLCNIGVISKICDALNKRGIEYHSSMISNGLYVGTYIDKIVKDWKFKKVQITVDGIGDAYNKIKNYKVWKSEDHFSILIKNIHLLLENKIRVSLRLNFDPVNTIECINLIDYLYTEFGNHKYLYVYCSHIFGENIPSPNDLNPNPYLDIYQKLIECGYVASLSDFRVIRATDYCGVYNKEFITVDPNGNLFKCEHEACHGKEYSFYSIYDSEKNINHSNLNVWETRGYLEKCINCKVYPICNGGCKYYELHGNSNEQCIPIKNCIEEIIKKFIQLKGV